MEEMAPEDWDEDAAARWPLRLVWLLFLAVAGSAAFDVLAHRGDTSPGPTRAASVHHRAD
jgi:hypothetical protein